ncbi:MAG: hypothetical protein U5K53_08580 [Halanaerobiales bacterium]|nr:hypothetical protein [Halanaerobiales bacterium]
MTTKYNINYQLKVDNDVEPSQIFDETVKLSWTSLAGDYSEERDGSE